MWPPGTGELAIELSSSRVGKGQLSLSDKRRIQTECADKSKWAPRRLRSVCDLSSIQVLETGDDVEGAAETLWDGGFTNPEAAEA
jgi:hypothetical protein